ncbi:putative secretory lipase [Hypoxylon sp. NC0597]|nr:putative secretory lipase [Hypoxylon sp. NC0597]
MYYLYCFFLAASSLTASLVGAQAQLVAEQSTAFNSSFSLSPSQIESANISSVVAANINTIINFDRSQLANGGPAEDTFYELPPLSNTTGAQQPSILLKVQEITDSTPFVTPPNTALSRILYTTTNYNETVVPASVFILWPFSPRRFQQSSPGTSQNKTAKAPVVPWTHGTSGFFASHAPSTHPALWYENAAPFTLALAGDIPHQYLLSSASAHDALYAMQASLKAFPDYLDENFGITEILAAKGEDEFKDLARGYLGSIAGSPTTDLFSSAHQLVLPWVGIALSGIFPDFELSDWMTPLGIARTQLLKEIEGGISVSQQLFLSGDDVVREDYSKAWYADAYAKIANAGRKPFKGPLLVIQGTQDRYVAYNVTSMTIEDTCGAVPEGDLEYLVVNGTGHVPTLDATRQVWLKWIEDRFEGRVLEKSGCVRTNLESFLPMDRYNSVGNSFPQFAGLPEYSYEVPLAL